MHTMLAWQRSRSTTIFIRPCLSPCAAAQGERQGRMKIVVDRDRCHANMVCMRTAPEAFLVDESDQLHVLVEEVRPELLPKVERAVKLCPRGALSLVEGPAEEPGA